MQFELANDGRLAAVGCRHRLFFPPPQKCAPVSRAAAVPTATLLSARTAGGGGAQLRIESGAGQRKRDRLAEISAAANACGRRPAAEQQRRQWHSVARANGAEQAQSLLAQWTAAEKGANAMRDVAAAAGGRMTGKREAAGTPNRSCEFRARL